MHINIASFRCTYVGLAQARPNYAALVFGVSTNHNFRLFDDDWFDTVDLKCIHVPDINLVYTYAYCHYFIRVHCQDAELAVDCPISLSHFVARM